MLLRKNCEQGFELKLLSMVINEFYQVSFYLGKKLAQTFLSFEIKKFKPGSLETITVSALWPINVWKSLIE